MKDSDVIYSSKRNRLVENGGALFLALEIDGRPNEDRLNVYRITDKAVLAADAISSDISDLDGDGFPEFGGSDLTAPIAAWTSSGATSSIMGIAPRGYC